MGFVPSDDEFDADAAVDALLAGSSPKAPAVAKTSSTKPRGNALTQADLEDVLREAGWQEDLIPKMSAIGMAESALTPDGRAKVDSYNPGVGPGGRKTVEESIGPWQINMHPSLKRNYDRKKLATDPVYNAKAALEIYNKQGLKAWGAFTDGRYKKHYKGKPLSAPQPFDADAAVDELLKGIGGTAPTDPVQAMQPASTAPVTELPATLERQRQAAMDPASSRIGVLYTDSKTAPEPALGEYDIPIQNGQLLRTNASKLMEYLQTTGTKIGDIIKGTADFTPLIGGKAEPTGEQYGTQGQIAVITYDEDGVELVADAITDPTSIATTAALHKKQFPGRKIRTEIVTGEDVVAGREQAPADPFAGTQATGTASTGATAEGQGEWQGETDQSGLAEANAYLASQGRPLLTQAEFDANQKDFGSDTQVVDVSVGDTSTGTPQAAPSGQQGEVESDVFLEIPVTNKPANFRYSDWVRDQEAEQLSQQLGADYDVVKRVLASFKPYTKSGNVDDAYYERVAKQGENVRSQIGPDVIAKIKAVDSKVKGQAAQFKTKLEEYKGELAEGETSSLAGIRAAFDAGYITEDEFLAQIASEKKAIAEMRDTMNRGEFDLTGIGQARLGLGKVGKDLDRSVIQPDVTKALEAIIKDHGTLSAYRAERKRLSEEYKYRPLAGPIEFAKNFGAALPKAVSSMLKTLDLELNLSPAKLVADAVQGKQFTISESVLSEMGDGINKYLESVKNPDFKDDAVLTVLPDTLGQLAVQLAAGALTGGASLPTAIGASMGAAAQYDEAKKYTKDDRLKILAATVGALAAVPDALAFSKWFKGATAAKVNQWLEKTTQSLYARLGARFGDDVAKETTEKAVTVLIRNMVKGSAFEGTQEVSENKINDWLALMTYDPSEARSKKLYSFNDEDVMSFIGGMIGGAGGGAVESVQDIASIKDRDAFVGQVNAMVDQMVADGSLDATQAEVVKQRIVEQAEQAAQADTKERPTAEPAAAPVKTVEDPDADIVPVAAEEFEGGRSARLLNNVEPKAEPKGIQISDKDGESYTVIEDRGDKGFLVEDAKGVQKVWPLRKFDKAGVAEVRDQMEQAGLKSVPVDSGETRVVYRLGAADEVDPSDRWVGTSGRVSEHIYESEQSVKGVGDTLFAYRVPVGELKWERQTGGQHGAKLPKGSKAELIGTVPFDNDFVQKTGARMRDEVEGEHIRRAFGQERQSPITETVAPAARPKVDDAIEAAMRKAAERKMPAKVSHNGVEVSIDPIKGLDERLDSMQRQAIARVVANPQQAIDDYTNGVLDSDGKPIGHKVFNADDAKTLHPEYNEDRIANVMGVHEASSIQAKLAMRSRLKEMPAGGQILATAGGAAAGKTRAAKKDMKEADLVFDGTMKSAKGNEEVLTEMLENGHLPRIIFVYRDVEEAGKSNVERSVEHGRVVPGKVGGAGHYDAADTLITHTYQWATDRHIPVKIIHNVQGGDPVEITLDDLKRLVYTRSREETIKAFYDAGLAEYEQHKEKYDDRVPAALDGRDVPARAAGVQREDGRDVRGVQGAVEPEQPGRGGTDRQVEGVAAEEGGLKKVDPSRTSALGVFSEKRVENKDRSAKRAIEVITKHMSGGMQTPIKEATSSEVEDAFYRNALADLGHWLVNYRDGYVSFYGEDIAKANEMLQEWAKTAHGRELAPHEIDLFHLLGSLSASGVMPREDSALATLMLDRYLRDGTISALDPMRFRPEFVGGEPTGNIRFEADPATGKSVVGTSRYSTKVHPEPINTFVRVLDYFKGDLKKAMAWINTSHPLQELLDVSGQAQLPSHEYLDTKNGGKGVFSLFSGTGAKLGSYYLNRIGNLETVTKDMWYGRGEARYLGLPLAHKDGKAIGGPVESNTVYGRRVRVAEDAAVKRLAKNFKVEPAVIQQWLWDFEQRLWEHAGMPAAKPSYISTGVADGIERLGLRSAAGERSAATVGVGVVREGTGKTIADTVTKFAKKAYKEALATNDRIIKAFNVNTSGTQHKFTVLNLHQQQNTVGVWEGTSGSMEESALYTVSGPADLVKAFAVTSSILAPNPQQAVMLDTYDRNGEGDETHITFKDMGALEGFVADRAKYNAGNLSLNPTTKTVIIVHNQKTDERPLKIEEIDKDYGDQITQYENRSVSTDFIDESAYRGYLQEARDSVQRHYPGKRGQSISAILDEADARLRKAKPELYEEAPLKSVAPLENSLGIPRSEMPQIRRDDHAEFIQFAKDRGVDIVEDSVRAGDLLPTQNEYNPEQAAQLPERAFDKRLMVSADNRVLDGHNTLVRLQVNPDRAVDVWRVDLPATEALGLMKDFPKVGYKTVAEVGPADSALKRAKTAKSVQHRAELELASTKAVLDRLRGGTLHENGELELNEADAELLRRLLAERYFQRAGEEIDEMPFDGIVWSTNYLRNLAEFGRTTGREQLKSAGMTEAQLAKYDDLMNALDATADANEGYSIAYVYDTALPHERVHKEDRNAGGVSPINEAKLLRMPIAQTAGTVFDEAYPHVNSTDKLSELVAIIASGEAAIYGLSTDVAAQQEFLRTWADAVIENNTQEIDAIGFPAWAQAYPLISAMATQKGEEYAENNQSTENAAAESGQAQSTGAVPGTSVSGQTEESQETVEGPPAGTQASDQVSDAGQGLATDAEIASATGRTINEVRTQNRKFAQTLADNLMDVGVVEYEPQTVEGWKAGAAETIEERGVDAAIEEYHRLPAGASEGRKTALGVAIAVELYTEGRTADLTEFGRTLTENIGNAAQELRAAALMSRLSPAFAGMYGDKVVMKAKHRVMTAPEREQIETLARQLEEAADAHALSQAALAEAQGLNEKFDERIKELEGMLAESQNAPAPNADLQAELDKALQALEDYKKQSGPAAFKVKGPKALRETRQKIETERPEIVALLQNYFPDTMLKLPAHHGTPHVFKAEVLVEYKDGRREFIEGDVDKMPKVPKGAKVVKEFPHGRFKIAKLGTGEGHAAYGAGLYFASKEKIADWYRENLSKGQGIQVLYDGKPVEFDKDRDDSTPEEIAIRDVAGSIANSDSRDSIPVEKMISSAKWGVQRRVDYAVEWLTAGPLSPGMEAQYDKDVKILDALDRIDPSKFEHREHKGARYNVDLKPGEDQYLDWDKPLSEQSDLVKEALAKRFPSVTAKDIEIDKSKDGMTAISVKGKPYGGILEKRSNYGTSYVATSLDSPPVIHRSLESAIESMTRGIISRADPLGSEMYHQISRDAIQSLNYGKPSQEFASNWLLQKGIRGNRYLDGDSRHGGAGSSNYVIFNDRDVAIESVLKQISMPNAPLNVSGFDQAAFAAERDSIPLVQDKAGKLLAPNGKISNIQNKDLWRTIRTKPFLEFFGDWVSVHNGKDGNGVWQSDTDVSKAVDENGEPAIMYHGTTRAGFGIFDPSMGQKVPGAIFWTTDRNMARSYSGTRDEAGIRPEPPAADMRSLQDRYPDADLTALEDLWHLEHPTPRKGIYSAFLNIRNPNEVDFEGANWDGTRDGQWSVETDDGDILYHPETGKGYFNDRLDAVEVKRLHLEDGSKWDRDELHIAPAQEMWQTTDSVAEEAKRYGNDGALIRDVSDSGGEVEHYGTATVIVTFKPTQIKSIFNRGSFDPNEGSILKSTIPNDLNVPPEAIEALVKLGAAKLIDEVPTGLTPQMFDKWLNEITGGRLGPREVAVVHALAHNMTRPAYSPQDAADRALAKNRLAHRQRADRIMLAEDMTDVTEEGIAAYKAAHTKQGPKKSEAEWGPKAGPKKPTSFVQAVINTGEQMGMEEETVVMALAQKVTSSERELKKMFAARFPDGNFAKAMNAGKQLLDLTKDQITQDKWEQKHGKDLTAKQINDLKNAIKTEATEERLKKKALERAFKALTEDTKDKVWGMISSIYNVPRSIMFSGDLGFLLAQGMPTLLMHPTAWWKAVSTGIPAGLADKWFEQAITAAYETEMRKRLETGGVKFEQIGNIADFNDDFMSDIARHIPFVKQTNRMHSMTTDLFRLYGGSADLMELDKMYEAGKLGKTPEENALNYNRSKEFLTKKWVNVMSGKGYLGALDPMGKALAQVGSAPRYTVSAFQIPYYANPLRAAMLPKGARKIMMKNSAKLWIPIITVLAVLSKLGLINDDPEDKDFLVIDMGKLSGGLIDMKINPLRAIKEPVRLTVGLPAKMLYYAYTGNKEGYERIAKSYYAAFVVDSYGGIGSFWKSKLHPTLSTTSQLYTGKNFVGEPLGWMDVLPLPLVIKEGYQAWTYDHKQSVLKTGADTGAFADNWQRIAATVVGSVIGFGANSYPASDTTTATKQLLSMQGPSDMGTDEDSKLKMEQAQKANQIERLIREGEDVSEIISATLATGQITKKQADQLAKTLADDLGDVQKRFGMTFTEEEKAVLMNNRKALKVLDYLYTDMKVDWRKIDSALKFTKPGENKLADREALAAAEAIVLEAVLKSDRITGSGVTTDDMVKMYEGLSPRMDQQTKAKFLEKLEKKARASNKGGNLTPEELEKVKSIIPKIDIVPRPEGTSAPVYKIMEKGSVEKALTDNSVKRWSTNDWVEVLKNAKLSEADRLLAEAALKKKAENARKSKTLTPDEVKDINSVMPKFKIQPDDSRGKSTTKKDD